MHWILLGRRGESARNPRELLAAWLWAAPKHLDLPSSLCLASHCSWWEGILVSLGIIQQNSGWFFMLQCQAVLRAGHKAGDKVMILQDLITEQFRWSKWWKFYFSDLEIIRQMTQYFWGRSCNITCLHEHSCKGEEFFCFMTFLNHVYLRGEEKYHGIF